ncbi:hypothetical protein [Undibacterium sp. TS12]|uniref:hypothetical protein n=1 Tax=Undibacterium sp. TS12 TaxID=2908202 RepID=UPI001F4D2E90|nr:hypothetical protein [Undibacterium sp. TS12]MCH8618608.1 hypothetical protein [Undibacterium sp. TS12]
MSHLELIIPFGIPPASLAKDLLKELHTPALAKLLACSSKPAVQEIDEFSRALSHEYWLAGQFPPEKSANSPANSWDLMQSASQTPSSGYWFLLQPVHIHIARDHLVLTDQRRLHIDETDARALFAVAAESCAEMGLTLLYGDAHTWFLRADAWSGLQTATVDAACGHNIDIWMPKGEFERVWRKLQNEIQMLWFTSDVNARREMQGKKAINSVWISRGANAPNSAARKYLVVHDLTNFLGNDTCIISQQTILLDHLSEAGLNNDWGLWLEQMHALEKKCFAPLLASMRNKQISSLDIWTSDACRLVSFKLSTWSLRKFWLRPSLNHLFSIS